MRRSLRSTLVKFGIFAVVMVLLTASLFFIFGQYQTGSTKDYSAVFADASRLETGQSVRVAGMRVGTVNSVKLQRDKTVLVTFDADPACGSPRAVKPRCGISISSATAIWN